MEEVETKYYLLSIPNAFVVILSKYSRINMHDGVVLL